MSIEAMKQALDALNGTDTHPISSAEQYFKERQAMKALEDAIKDAEERQWVGLTDEEIDGLNYPELRYIGTGEYVVDGDSVYEFAKHIEAKLKKKNT
jgi:hypothetical protein